MAGTLPTARFCRPFSRGLFLCRLVSPSARSFGWLMERKDRLIDLIDCFLEFLSADRLSLFVFGCKKSFSVLSPRLICTRGKDATFATIELISTPTFVLFTLAHLYACVFFLSPSPRFLGNRHPGHW